MQPYPVWLPAVTPIFTGHPTVVTYRYRGSYFFANAVHIEDGKAYYGWVRQTWINYQASGSGWAWEWGFLLDEKGSKMETYLGWENDVF